MLREYANVTWEYSLLGSAPTTRQEELKEA